jgi:protein associated with RNAse G/E
MRKVRVVSKKYDGSLRDEYETDLYLESDEAVILFSVPGLRYYDHRKAAWFASPDGLLEIYFKQRWYNVWHIAEQVSNRNLIYVNLALPATLRENTLEWVDLDLDYRLHLDRKVELLDQADFDHTTQRLRYPSSLLEHVRAACQEIESGLTRQEYPFDHERQVELYRRIKHETMPGGADLPSG